MQAEVAGRTLYQVGAPRPYVEPVDDPDYGDEQVRRLRTRGEIKWNGTVVFVSEGLAGEAVGIREREDDRWAVRGPVAELKPSRELSGMYPD